MTFRRESSTAVHRMTSGRLVTTVGGGRLQAQCQDVAGSLSVRRTAVVERHM